MSFLAIYFILTIAVSLQKGSPSETVIPILHQSSVPDVPIRSAVSEELINLIVNHIVRALRHALLVQETIDLCASIVSTQQAGKR